MTSIFLKKSCNLTLYKREARGFEQFKLNSIVYNILCVGLRELEPAHKEEC